MEPTHIHRTGEPNMIGQPFPHDMWQLETELDEDESLDAHLKWLTAKLEPHYDYLCSLKSVAEVYVYCGVNCDSDQCGFSLSSEALTMFTAMGIRLELTILIGDGTSRA